MSHFKTSLLRRLKFKAKEVSSDLEETKIIYKNAVSEFCIALEDFCLKQKINNPLNKTTKEEEPDKEISSEFKALFRKIASATHPDKISTEAGRPKLQKAVEAKKTNKTIDLINIASELKIETNNLSFSSIEELEKSIKDTEDEINSIHNSYPWAWYYAPQSKKDNILSLFIESQV